MLSQPAILVNDGDDINIKNNERKLQSARILNNEGDSANVVKSNDYEQKQVHHHKT